MLPSVYSGLHQVTAGYRVVTVGYSRLQQVTEWLQWVTAGYSRLPSGYRPIETSNSGANHAVLHAQNYRCGLGPIGTIYSGHIIAVVNS